MIEKSDHRRSKDFYSKRTILTSGPLVLLPGQWIAPVVTSVVLPAHATTSNCNGQVWELQIDFDSAQCSQPEVCGGLSVQQMIDASVKPNSNEIFCITDHEISKIQFNRDIDLDGNGPAADYVVVSYTFTMLIDDQAQGTVIAGDVDSFISIMGNWTAVRIS